MKNPVQEVDKLREELRLHEHQYYVLDDPKISDAEYDALRDQDYDEDSARFFVAEEIEAVLKRWGVQRRLVAED